MSQEGGGGREATTQSQCERRIDQLSPLIGVYGTVVQRPELIKL